DARPLLVQAESLMGRLSVDFPDLPDIPFALASSQNNLGAALRRLGETAEAEKFYRKAIKTLSKLVDRFQDVEKYRPLLVTAYYNLGNTLSVQKKLDAAVDAYKEAIKLQPKHVLAQFKLGEVLSAQKKLNDAFAAFRKADQLRPNDPLIRTKLSQTE